MLVNIILRMDSVKSGEKYHTVDVYRSMVFKSMSQVIFTIFFLEFQTLLFCPRRLSSQYYRAKNAKSVLCRIFGRAIE